MMQDSAARNGETAGPLEQLHDRVAGAADAGAWDTVRKECDAYFAAGGHSAEAHYLSTLSAFVADDFASALAHARRALAIDSDVREYAEQDTLKNLRFDSGSRPPMAEPGKWAFGGNAPQRGINTR